MFHQATRMLALLTATAAALGALAAAPALAAPACAVNCTNGTVSVGSTIGTTGFPTSFTMSGSAGSTVTATASPYSISSNLPWKLTFTTDPADGVPVPGGGGTIAAYWQAGTANFPIAGSTTITHGGNVFNIPSVNGVASVQIDSGPATANTTAFSDVFSVAIPAAQAPGAYTATFAYVLAAS